MSTPQYLLCANENVALAVDAAICNYLRTVDGNRGSRWSGVQQKANANTVAIVWEPQLAPLWPELVKIAGSEPAKLGPIDKLPLETAILDAQTKLSNWTEKPVAVAAATVDSPADNVALGK